MSKKNTFVAKSTGIYSGWLYRIIFACFLIPMYFGAITYGQDPAKPQILIDLTNAEMQPGDGSIELFQVGQIENMLKLYIANNKLQNGIPGYRLRIFSQSGQTARQKATEVRASFMKSFPETDAYMVYNNPNFQVLVGNFRTKTEARYEKKNIEKKFPGAFIVSEIIEIPK